MHLCIFTISSPVPITMQNTVQVPRRILTCEVKRQSLWIAQKQWKESSALLSQLCHILDSALLYSSQTGRKAVNTSAKSVRHRWLSPLSYLSFSELSDEDFNHLCVWAVDALGCLKGCHQLLRGVYSEDKISRLKKTTQSKYDCSAGCLLAAYDLVPFERQGVDWVRTINPPVVAAEMASGSVFRFVGSAGSSGSCGASSLWVLESLLGALGTTQGWGCRAAAPVRSSERLFPVSTDKERRLLNYALTSTFTHLPCWVLPMTILDGAILEWETICIPL